MQQQIAVLIKSLSTVLREKLTPMQARIAALESRIDTLEKRPPTSYKGVWSASERYTRGDFVTYGGSVWAAARDTQTKPGFEQQSRDWVLAVKAGKDGKDLR